MLSGDCDVVRYIFISGEAKAKVFICILFLSSSYGDICAVASLTDMIVSPTLSLKAMFFSIISSKCITLILSMPMGVSSSVSISVVITDARRRCTESSLSDNDIRYMIATIADKNIAMYFNGLIRLCVWL